MPGSGDDPPRDGSPGAFLGILGRFELPEATATWPSSAWLQLSRTPALDPVAYTVARVT
jgi:hypothetical protein